MNYCQIDRFDDTTFLVQCRKENKFTYPSFDLSTLLAVDDYGILTLSQLLDRCKACWISSDWKYRCTCKNKKGKWKDREISI